MDLNQFFRRPKVKFIAFGTFGLLVVGSAGFVLLSVFRSSSPAAGSSVSLGENATAEDYNVAAEGKMNEFNSLTLEYKSCTSLHGEGSRQCKDIQDKAKAAITESIRLTQKASYMVGADASAKFCELQPNSPDDHCGKAEEFRRKASEY